MARPVLALMTAFLVSGCINAYFQAPESVIDERAYTAIFPYFVEYCAESEFNKKPGIGLKVDSGGPGGHSVFYLNGACRESDAGYPVLMLCPQSPTGMAGHGVGVSTNSHYRNAEWTATEGRSFFFRGALAPGEGVTHASFARTLEEAKSKRILDGIVFGDDVLKDKPAGMTVRDYMYEISVGTDFGLDLARDRYCARVPLTRAKLQAIVAFLNAVNEPYRRGEKVFRWNVITDNCVYLAHNALAAAGLWPRLPVDRPLVVAAFDFPVPKNEFVNIARRANDEPIADPDALYSDAVTRTDLLDEGWIPTQPGGLLEARRVVEPNDVYGTHLRLIFYDEPVFGQYQTRFESILSQPRYTQLAANLSYFSGLYAEALAQESKHSDQAHPAFDRRYRDVIAANKSRVEALLARVMASAD